MKRVTVFIALFLLALAPDVARAQGAVVGGPVVLSGGTVNVNSEPAVYSVKLDDGGTQVVSIAVRIDGAGGSPITDADIAFLRLYVDKAPRNDVLDVPGDDLLGSAPVTVGVTTTVADTTGGTVLSPGKWFFVSILFKPSAVGKSFTVTALAGNIIVDPPGPPPPTNPAGNVGAGPGLAVMVITAGAPVSSPSPATSIPAMPPEVYGLLALFLLGYGIYSLNRRGR